MTWTPPTGVIPTDRKSPSVPTAADIPAMLDWLRDYYPGNTVIGVLATARAERMTYRVDGEPGYGTPGTLSNYTLTKLDWDRDVLDAALADIPDQVAAGLAPVDAALDQVADIIADTAQQQAENDTAQTGNNAAQTQNDALTAEALGQLQGIQARTYPNPIYVGGVEVAAAMVDGQDRAYMYIGTDGRIYYPAGTRTAGPLTVDGLATLANLAVGGAATLGTMSATQAAVGGVTTSTDPAATYPYLIADTAGNIAIAIRADGSLSAFGAEPQIGTVQHVVTGAGYGSDVAWGIAGADGSLPIYLDGTGTLRVWRLQAQHLLDANGNPFSVSALPSGARADGTLLTSLREIDCWGDSMTFGLQSSDRLTKSYPAVLAQTLGRTINNWGASGATSTQIAARAGALPISVTVPSGSIPASGTITLDVPSPEPYYNTTGGVPAWLHGVYGTLSRTGAGGSPSYTFARAQAGAAVPISGAVSLVLDSAARWERTTIIWAGRNDGPGVASNLIAVRDNIAAIIRRLEQQVAMPRYLVLGIHYRVDEATGTTARTNIAAHNALLATQYGPAFVDPNRVLAANADGTPYAGGGGNPAYFDSDNLHCNDAGYALVAQAVATQLTRRGI